MTAGSTREEGVGMIASGPDFRQTWLWRQAFQTPRSDSTTEEQEFFRTHYLHIRERAAQLVSRIAVDSTGSKQAKPMSRLPPKTPSQRTACARQSAMPSWPPTSSAPLSKAASPYAVGLTSSYLLHHPLPDDWEKQRVLVATL